jgi:beta-alanine degradation protein BauB
MTDILPVCQDFAAAWNRHDLETIMAMHTPDCAFWAAAGADAEGGRHEGPDAVRAAYRALFELYPDGRWTNGRIAILSAERALSEWRFIGTTKAGKRVEVDGLDLLDFVGDKVRLKNSFRKQRA